MRPGKFTLSILVLAVLVPVARAGSPKWLRVTSANFVVYSDATEARARAIAERLEGFHALLVSLLPGVASAPPSEKLVVVAFRSDAAFAPYRPNDGKSGRIKGLFLGSSDRDLIALDASADDGSYRVVFHEYVHKVANRTRLVSDSLEATVPLWFDEGFADFYSTATTEGLRAHIGENIDGHRVRLRDGGLMPLAQMFAVTPDSPEYTEHEKQDRFYAQAWLFIHAMMLGKDGTRQKGLVDFVERLGKGSPAAEAFRAAFGADMSDVDAELRSYVKRENLPYLEITFKSATPIDAAVVEDAPEAEVEFYLGTALAIEGRHVEAQAHFLHAAEVDPKSSLPYEGLGFVAIYRNDRAAAREAFARATERNSKSYYAQYFFAETAIESGDRSALDAAAAALDRAVAINPLFAGSYALHSRLALRRGDNAKATEWATRGLAVAPYDGRIRYALAAAQMDARKYAEARATLGRLLETEKDKATRLDAQRLLKSLDILSAQAAKPSAAPAAPPNPARPRSFEELRRSLRVAPAGVLCTLVKVDCASPAITLHVRIDGRDATFANPSVDDVTLLSTDPNAGVSVDCENSTNREVIVEFEPSAPGATTGLLKAVVFLDAPSS